MVERGTFKGQSDSHLELLLLASVRARPSHGYAIIQELRRKSLGEFNFAAGTIYPLLHRLEDEGLLSSKEGLADGRRVRVYQLTNGGRRRLGEQTANWRRFSTAMRSVIEPE